MAFEKKISIAIGADYSFDIKSGFSIAPAFSLHKNFDIASVWLYLNWEKWLNFVHELIMCFQISIFDLFYFQNATQTSLTVIEVKYLVSIQELFVVKSGLWWCMYGS